MDEEAPPPTERGRVRPVPARADRQISALVNLLRERGLPPEAIQNGDVVIADAPVKEPDPPGLIDPEPGVPVTLPWGDDPVTGRLMVKVACELIAYFNAELGRRPELMPARDYARYGRGDWHIAADSSTEGSRLPLVDAELIHSVDVWTRGRFVHFRFGIFSTFRFVGTLTAEWSGLPMRMMYSFDCRNPTNCDFKAVDGEGDFVVRQSARTAQSEFLTAADRLDERIRSLTPTINAYRAESLTESQLHEGASKQFATRPWPLKAKR